jgi:Uma2 family endonuclease
MSTISRHVSPPPRDWTPSRLAKLSIEQYEAMVESGVLGAGARLQLINGFLVAKETKKPSHGYATESTREVLRRILPTGWSVRSELPVRLPPLSEPEPDVSVARGNPKDYATRHPGPEDLALVVEVAAGSLRQDRKLAVTYGSSGIPTSWIINLRGPWVEVYSDPTSAGYGSRRDYKPGEKIAVVIDGSVVGQIGVDGLFP